MIYVRLCTWWRESQDLHPGSVVPELTLSLMCPQCFAIGYHILNLYSISEARVCISGGGEDAALFCASGPGRGIRELPVSYPAWVLCWTEAPPWGCVTWPLFVQENLDWKQDGKACFRLSPLHNPWVKIPSILTPSLHVANSDFIFTLGLLSIEILSLYYLLLHWEASWGDSVWALLQQELHDG